MHMRTNSVNAYIGDRLLQLLGIYGIQNAILCVWLLLERLAIKCELHAHNLWQLHILQDPTEGVSIMVMEKKCISERGKAQ